MPVMTVVEKLCATLEHEGGIPVHFMRARDRQLFEAAQVKEYTAHKIAHEHEPLGSKFRVETTGAQEVTTTSGAEWNSEHACRLL